MTSANIENVLNKLEYYVFWAYSPGHIIPVNQNAHQLFKDLSEYDNLFKKLFNLKNFEQTLALGNSHQLKEVEIESKDGREKTIEWEFVNTNNGIFCVASDWKPVRELVKKFENDNLIFKEILLNILPEYIAEELIAKKAVRPKVYRRCTILFTDVVDFSKIAFHLDPVSLIRKLNSYFSLYDRIMDEFGIEKIKTIGDSYMCASGIPVQKPSHSVDACLAVLNILHLMDEMKKSGRMADGLDLKNWSIRIGIHTGPCISGVVGFKKYNFDIWGDSVNIASRMEKAGAPGKINISESTYEEVNDFFDCRLRGDQEVKNIGVVKMYFLNRIKPGFSEDENGFFPNEKFNKYYCGKFWSEKKKIPETAMPHFIKNYLESKKRLGK